MTRNFFLQPLWILLLALVLLPACSTTHPHAQAQSSASQSRTHTVAKGETLYSIAFVYGLNYQSLAKANHIDRNYTIYPGQVLHLDAASSKKVSATSSSKATQSQVTESKKVSTSVSSNSNNNVSNNEGSVSWIWPAKGAVMQRYSESGAVNKGIDIGGNSGDPVLASASGKVVYAGSGLLGYGQLVIIKHNEQLLSAYAHNRVLLVKEGDEVKGGQKIAEIGSTGTDKVKLHFEIRRDGKPVDPEQYLPRR